MIEMDKFKTEMDRITEAVEGDKPNTEIYAGHLERIANALGEDTGKSLLERIADAVESGGGGGGGSTDNFGFAEATLESASGTLEFTDVLGWPKEYIAVNKYDYLTTSRILYFYYIGEDGHQGAVEIKSSSPYYVQESASVYDYSDGVATFTAGKVSGTQQQFNRGTWYLMYKY